MHIVHIEETFHPAYGYQVQNFCRHHDRTHRIDVVTGATLRGRIVSEDADALRSLDAEFTQRTGAGIHRLPVSWGWHHKTWLAGLHRKLAELAPDVIFSHGLEYLSLPRLLLRDWDRRCVVVTDSHDVPTAAFHPRLRRLYGFFVQRWCVRALNARNITCYYTAEATRLHLNAYGVDPRLQKPLPIGTSIDVFRHDSEARLRLREAWGFGAGDVVMLYTGKHDADKSPHQLYEALRLVETPKGGRLGLVSVGPRDESYFKANCEPLLARLRGEGVLVHVEPAVPSSRLRDYYSAADIAVFPCRNTLSCLDAMACGLPVVMQEDMTNQDRLHRGGRVFPAGDTAALARVLGELVSDQRLRSALGAAGALDMAARFDYAAVVRRLEEELSVAVAARSGRPS